MRLLRLQKEVFLPEGYFAVSNFTKDSLWVTWPRKGQKRGHCTKELPFIFCVPVPSFSQYAELEKFDLSTHFKESLLVYDACCIFLEREMQISLKMICHFLVAALTFASTGSWITDWSQSAVFNSAAGRVQIPLSRGREVLPPYVCTYVKLLLTCPIASVQTLMQAVLSRGGSELGALFHAVGQWDCLCIQAVTRTTPLLNS